MKYSYKGVIFDFNGTLFFDNDKHVRAWGTISRLIRGYDISEEELHNQFNGTPNIQNILYMTNHQATPEELTKYSQLKEEYYRQYCKEDVENFHLVDGTKEYFDSLKQNHIPFTIASASIKENIDFFRESFDLDRWIHPHHIVYDDGTYTNKVQMFKDAAKRIHVDIKDVLVYEDSFSGIKNAYEAGVKSIIVVCPKENSQDYRHLPGVIGTIETFDEVLG